MVKRIVWCWCTDISFLNTWGFFVATNPTRSHPLRGETIRESLPSATRYHQWPSYDYQEAARSEIQAMQHGNLRGAQWSDSSECINAILRTLLAVKMNMNLSPRLHLQNFGSLLAHKWKLPRPPLILRKMHESKRSRSAAEPDEDSWRTSKWLLVVTVFKQTCEATKVLGIMLYNHYSIFPGSQRPLKNHSPLELLIVNPY